MPLEPFNQALEYGSHPHWGSSRVATGTSLFVMNSDYSTAAAGNIQNPWGVLAGGTGHEGHRVVGVPRAYNWLDVYHATDSDSFTGGTYRVFGRLPHRPVSSARSWPQDIDPVNFADLEAADEGIWVQLPSIAADGTLSYAGVVSSTSISVTRAGFILNDPATFQLKGSVSVMAIVASGGDGGNTNLLLGQFHG
jgi:hypothetical protein